MTLRQMTELVQLAHPDVGRTEIIFQLNHALREYGQRVRLPYADLTLTRLNDLISEDLTKPEWVYRIPSGVYEVRDTTAVNVNEFEVGNNTITFSYLANPNDDITIRYWSIPAVLVSMGDIPNIPSWLHQAPVARVLADYYLRKGNTNMFKLQQDNWNSFVKEGLIYANTKPWRNQGTPDHLSDGNVGGGGGNGIIFSSGRQVLEPGLNTVNLLTTFSAPDSYNVLFNDNGILASEYNPNNNFDQRTVSTIVVSSADHNDNFEFMARGT